MDSKCKYWMLLLTLLCVISLGFSLFREFPCEVGNETFLGIVLSAVGIIVTLVMGYQIFSVVEFRGELQKQKEENIKLAHDNAKLQQMIRNQMGALDKQKGRIEEGLNMCFSYTSNPQPIGFSGILLAKRQNSFIVHIPCITETS